MNWLSRQIEARIATRAFRQDLTAYSLTLTVSRLFGQLARLLYVLYLLIALLALLILVLLWRQLPIGD
jgi:hypothetical protein